ncbi:MAG: hypothetical protein Ta2A_19910 [Treponemataceae bacterium]|nr:MAG: hypothetical protein Ta2A_19910 [Treponemataceae bacterium]
MNDGKKTPNGEIYAKRLEIFAEWMQSQEIAASVFEDSEEKRNAAIRYFTGHPSDALLVITNKAQSILLPWDVNLAGIMAHATDIIPYMQFKKDAQKACAYVLRSKKIKKNERVDIPESTYYNTFLEYVNVLQDWTVTCKKNENSSQKLIKMRAVKDESEIAAILAASEITNTLIDEIEANVRSGKIKTESDAALFIEKRSRELGAEGASFEILAAGPARSFGIHAFPPYTVGAFGTKGLSILDFGVTKDGYRSDVTMTIAAGKLSSAQEAQIALMQDAYHECLLLYKNGESVLSPAKKCTSVFAKAKREMPHGLGHGVGLDIHEYPFVRTTATEDTLFQTGMVVTLEPGLYSPENGGCRYENDILITDTGNAEITRSKIVRL